tara:strand:+ start:1555 stop:2142 length:588 start_codon:yes stop_codon:yes gene_type:complete
MTKDGYEVYIMYLALQRHFSTNYDYFQYNGKVKASKDAYSARNDIFSFEKLTKIIRREDREDFFVAHFLENPKEWIRNMSKTKMDEFRAKFRMFPIKFKEDLYYLQINGPAAMLACEPDKIPLIHSSCINGSISLETICVLDDIFPYLEKHEQTVTVPFVWPDHINKVKKYKPFVKKKLQCNFINIVDIARDVLL